MTVDKLNLVVVELLSSGMISSILCPFTSFFSSEYYPTQKAPEFSFIPVLLYQGFNAMTTSPSCCQTLRLFIPAISTQPAKNLFYRSAGVFSAFLISPFNCMFL